MKIVFDDKGYPIGSEFTESELKLLEKQPEMITPLSELGAKEFEMYANFLVKTQEEITKRVKICQEENTKQIQISNDTQLKLITRDSIGLVR